MVDQATKRRVTQTHIDAIADEHRLPVITRDRETAWALSKQIPIAMDDLVLSGLANVVLAAMRCGMITEDEFVKLAELGARKREELRDECNG